ncbi:matrix metalloproteinase-18-like [Ciona intestinalis]
MLVGTDGWPVFRNLFNFGDEDVDPPFLLQDDDSWVEDLQGMLKKQILNDLPTIQEVHPSFIEEEEIPTNNSVQTITRFLTNYMKNFGYLNLTVQNEVDLVSIPRVDSGFRDPNLFYVRELDKHISDQIKNMQYMLGIPTTGKLDETTLHTMVLPRCGMKDIEPSGVGDNFVLQGRWVKNNLTYRILNVTSRLTRSEFTTAMSKAAKLWTDVTPLTITQVDANTPADIDVYFADGNHGDGFNFDGIGGTLAHGFYPPPDWEDHNVPTLAGDIHFDLTEKFVANSDRGVDILQVELIYNTGTAVHELGHSLGLMHSHNKNAVMAPVYRRYNPSLQLHQDDVDGIQLLYGNQVFRINQIGVLDGYPMNIEDIFHDAPHNIDAALTLKINREKATYLIKGNKYWKYKSFGLVEVNHTRTLWPGIPHNINAAFYIPKHGKLQATIYFIEGCKVHMYKVLANKQFMKFNKVNLCHQLPSVDVEHITAATVQHRRLYIFIGNIYYRLRVRNR